MAPLETPEEGAAALSFFAASFVHVVLQVTSGKASKRGESAIDDLLPSITASITSIVSASRGNARRQVKRRAAGGKTAQPRSVLAPPPASPVKRKLSDSPADASCAGVAVSPPASQRVKREPDESNVPPVSPPVGPRSEALALLPTMLTDWFGADKVRTCFANQSLFVTYDTFLPEYTFMKPLASVFFISGQSLKSFTHKLAHPRNLTCLRANEKA